MKLALARVRDGLHPSEALVSIQTDEGLEHAYVQRAALDGQGLEVHWPVGSRPGELLVELPAETTAGAWRVWVPETSVS